MRPSEALELVEEHQQFREPWEKTSLLACDHVRGDDEEVLRACVPALSNDNGLTKSCFQKLFQKGAALPRSGDSSKPVVLVRSRPLGTT